MHVGTGTGRGAVQSEGCVRREAWKGRPRTHSRFGADPGVESRAGDGSARSRRLRVCGGAPRGGLRAGGGGVKAAAVLFAVAGAPGD